MNNLPVKCKNKNQKELEALRRFIDFYNYEKNTQLGVIDCDVLSDDKIHNFDFLLIDKVSKKKIAIEHTRLMEKESIFRNRKKSAEIINNLSKKVKEIETKNFYWIRMPLTLPLKINQNDFVNKVFIKVKNLIEVYKNKKIKFEINGVSFVIEKSDVHGLKGVELFIYESISIPGPNFAPRFNKAFKDKNLQLNTSKADIKILLIYNQFNGVEYETTLKTIFALNPVQYKFIDQVYYEFVKGKFYIVHDKKIFEFLTQGSIPDIVPNYLRKLTFDYLPVFINNDKEKSYCLIESIIGKEDPWLVIKDATIREEIVTLGDWLTEKGRFNETIWLIDKFLNDPDPEEPGKYKGDPDFNYHKKIVEGEDLIGITTVLGKLAWLVRKLTVQKDYIKKALNYTKQLLSHKNLYIKRQAIFPLIEIAARRQWLDGYGKRPYQGAYKEFHKLVFDLVSLVEKNPNYKAIANRLTNVFVYYNDLSTEEAEKVLDVLKITEESAVLFVNFGIFRQRHYKDQPIEFRGDRLEKKLREIISNTDGEYRSLRKSIILHFREILNENKNEFETIKPYIDLILKQPYQRDIYYYVEIIIKDWIKDRLEVCVKWYKKLLLNISKFVEQKQNLQTQGGLWLMSTEEIVEEIANSKPNDLLEVMKTLVDLWKKALIISSPERLFESFKLIPNEKKQKKVKKEFKKLYKSMKKIDPKIERVDWT